MSNGLKEFGREKIEGTTRAQEVKKQPYIRLP
jgi:hypothetical protein